MRYFRPMPIYEFHCVDCERDSELLVRSAGWRQRELSALWIGAVGETAFHLCLGGPGRGGNAAHASTMHRQSRRLRDVQLRLLNSAVTTNLGIL